MSACAATFSPVGVSAVILHPGEVAVWQASLDGQPESVFAGLQSLLSPDELKRAAAFHFERERRRFVVARGVLRTLLGECLGQDPRELGFSYGEFGKPALDIEADDASLAFNVAHAGGVALFALSRAGEVGIDVEQVRSVPEWEEIATTHFPPATVARLAPLPPEERAHEFFRAWCRHEAILKAHGAGLSGEVPPEFSLSQRVHAWEPAPGFTAALALGRHVPSLNFHGWPKSTGKFPVPVDASRVRPHVLSESSPNLL
jgi:4'-phosphopantetheinyl transferase